MKVRRPKQKYNLCEVIWDDATSLSQGWKNPEEFAKEPIKPEIVLSVGFVVKETEDYLILAMDTDSDGDHASRSQIPKGMVRSMKVLRKADLVPVIVSKDTSKDLPILPTIRS